MPNIRIAILTAFGDLLDWTPFATEATWDDGDHGCRSLTMVVPRRIAEAYTIFAASRTPEVRVTRGAQVLWRGRIDSPSLELGPDGTTVTLRALGGWQALRADRHTALWSDARLGRWRPLSTEDRAARLPERFVIDQQNRLFIGLKKNQTYTNGVIGAFGYQIPASSSRPVVGLICEVQHNLPSATWAIVIQRATGGFGGTLTTLQTIVGTGATATVGVYLNWLASDSADALLINVLYNSGAGVVYAGEDGASYVRMTKTRVVSALASTLADTLGGAIAAGARTITPPAGMAKIYVGQQLYIGGASPEIVTVTAVTATTFDATFAQAHLSTDIIRAWVVYAAEVVEALRASAVALNPGQLSADTSQVQDTALDLTDAVYEDARSADVIDDLARRGDGAGQQIETGVDAQLRLYFRPKGSQARRWFVRLDQLSLDRPRSTLANRVYATYDGPGESRLLRTASADDTISQAQYGVVAVGVVEAATSNADLAAQIRDLALADRATPMPAGAYTIRQLETEGGAIVSGDVVRPGDTVTIRNLPPAITLADARIRTFRVSETTYDPIAGAAQVVPETPLPLLEVLIAQGLVPG